MPALYEITDEMRRLEDYLERVDESGVELGESEQHQILQILDAIEADREAKLDGYATVVRKLESEASIAEEEYRRWRDKAESRKRRIGFLKSVLLHHFESLGERKVSTSRYTLSICSNGGHQPMEVNSSLLPEQYWYRPPAEPSTTAIREALKKGEAVPGVELLPRGKHIRIK